MAKSCSRLFQNILNSLDVENPFKLIFLSGHDTTINSIRVALQAQDYSWPEFAASIAFELYRDMETAELKLLVLFDFVPVILNKISDDVLIELKMFEEYVKFNLSI